MIALDQVLAVFPAELASKSVFHKHLLKEYIQLAVLDFLASTPYVRDLVFIGGTNLRLVKGIDRFSEDLDFDCKALTRETFLAMTEDVMRFLGRSGFKVQARDRENPRLTAYRRNIHFPELLLDLRLSGHRDERFLLKLEAQDQGVCYDADSTFIKGGGFFFSFPVPPDGVLCAMKLAALLSRARGRDFYDAIFLLSRAEPDFGFLSERAGVGSPEELRSAMMSRLATVDLRQKQREFEHLLFNRENSRKILDFREFIEAQNW